MGKMCYLCRRIASKSDQVSLFTFPKDPIARQKWMKVCDLLPSDNLKYIYICSVHFSVEHIDRGNQFQTRCTLKMGAVPSIGVPNPTCSENENTETSNGSAENTEVIHVNTSNDNLTAIDNGNRTTLNNVNNNICSQELRSPTYPSEEALFELKCDDFIKPSQLETADVTMDRKVDENYGESKENYCTSPKRRVFEPRYLSEIRVPDFESPKRAKRVLNLIRDTDKKKSKLIKSLQDRNRKFEKRISSLQQIIAYLKEKQMISNDSGNTLLAIMDGNDIASSEVKVNGEYTPKIRSFSMTLHFYSAKAYDYVRSKFDNQLPHPSTIRAWYRVVDGSPGFTTEALQAIKLRTAEKTVVVNLVLDEMSIREQLIYNDGRFHGCVDFGDGHDNENDNATPATNALVFMAVSLNDSWKVPIGYFLIRSLDSKERAKLIKLALRELSEINCKVYSITFDGAAANISMCSYLGANLVYGPNFQPYFTNPVTNETCYVFYDLCHMIKLVRNTLGDLKILQTADGEEIAWNFIEKLFELQKEEGLRLANKLTKKHIYYYNSKMNVKLAMQTLSNSICCSLLCLKNIDDLKVQQIFEKCQATATFCKNFNDMSDILNCKNKFAKGTFNIPLNDENMEKLKREAESFEKYINSLYSSDKKVVQSSRKTGFIGIIIGLRNMFPLFEQLKKVGMTYLLTYKLSQDYLETYFSAIRSRGGFNNNPNALQFKSAYKRLLVRHELKEFENGNCLFDSIDILHITSKQNNIQNPIGNHSDLNFNFEADHDYNFPFWELSTFVENVVLYISGFIAYKLSKNIVKCEVCLTQLQDDISKGTMPLLSQIKNRGPYVVPSSDVIAICKVCEQIMRKYHSKLTQPTFKTFLICKIFNHIGLRFDNKKMNNHILTQAILDNHRVQLCKYVIELYLNTRLHYEAKKMSEKDVSVRQKYTKLILFKNQ